ncbi:MAG: ABC transporter ATP-binding protein [Gammaproteobacteria bacterium]|nr:ABC transporter ATP-binding protein [Gammaproteobacteria bacterium]
MTLALKNVSLRVDGQMHIYDTSIELVPNGFNILLGTTLAGKTTLMRLMAGLVVPTHGEVWFNGVDVTGVAVQKRNVSMVYQQFINYPNMSVFDNIASPLRLARYNKDEIRQRVSEVASLLRLDPFLKRKPSELSGGQQQRCAMARALVKDSDLVLLDEPLANLDYKLREELREELPRLFATRERTVVYATTEPSEALLLGGYTAAMDEGRITQFGPTGEIYRRPADRVTASVFSDPPINTVAVRKHGARFTVIGSDAGWRVCDAFTRVADGEYEFAVRPHHVRPANGVADGAIVEGKVLVAEISGSESTVHFDMHGQSWVSLTHGIHCFNVGQTARFLIDIDHSMLFSTTGELVAAQGG